MISFVHVPVAIVRSIMIAARSRHLRFIFATPMAEMKDLREQDTD